MLTPQATTRAWQPFLSGIVPARRAYEQSPVFVWLWYYWCRTLFELDD